MRLINQFSNLSAFEIITSNSILLKRISVESYNLYLNDQIIVSKPVDFSFNILFGKDIIFLSDFEGNNDLIDIKGNVLNHQLDYSREANYFYSKDYGISFIIKGEIYSSEYSKDEEAICEFFYNFNSKWKINYFGRLNFYSDKIALIFPKPIRGNNDTSQFTKLNYETGQKEWDFDLNDHLDKIVSAYPYDNAPFDGGSFGVKTVLGVYKNQLWFAMSNYGLLCLDNTTGEFMHYLRDCPQNTAGDVYLPYGGYPVLPFTENAVLLPDEGKIIVFDSMYYWQLDLETLELDFHFLEDYFKEVDCYTFSTRYKKLIVEGEKIYIVAYRSKKFACFNRRTLKYDWIEPLPEGSGAPRSIEKHGNRLYIDTSKKELLVYELEENEIENNL